MEDKDLRLLNTVMKAVTDFKKKESIVHGEIEFNTQDYGSVYTITIKRNKQCQIQKLKQKK